MFQVGLENNIEWRSLAWILGHPGCFAYGADGAQALAAVPQAIWSYSQWIGAHTDANWLDQAEVKQAEYQVEDTWECYFINEDYELVKDGYEVNAWFRHDWIPLKEIEIQHGLLLHGWGRKELYRTVRDIGEDLLQRTYPQERWSIAGILKHIGSAEWWYLDRLGLAFPRQELPDDPFERLEKVRPVLVKILTGLAGSSQVMGVDGEFWSPRKLLRRAVWHEYDHIEHIKKLL